MSIYVGIYWQKSIAIYYLVRKLRTLNNCIASQFSVKLK
jgi:hypothetical protein